MELVAILLEMCALCLFQLIELIDWEAYHRLPVE